MTTIRRERKLVEAGWEFIPLWILVNAAGWLVASLVGSSFSQTNPLWTAVSGIVGGAVIGALEWTVMRRYFRAAEWWVLATAAGYGLALPLLGIIAGLLDLLTRGSALWLAYGLDYFFGGLLSALPQWLFLRGHLRRAGWWLPASGLAWAGGWVVVLLTNLVSGASWSYFTTVGAIYGLLSGFGLLALLLVGRSQP